VTIQSLPQYTLITHDGRQLSSGTAEHRAYLAGLDYPKLTAGQLAAIWRLLSGSRTGR